MKNKSLLFALSFLLSALGTRAQIVNASFENWQVDTNKFAGLSPYLNPDTFTYTDPVGWTSTNSITELPALGSISFVNRDTNAYEGQYAVRVITDTISASGQSLILPGFLLNGTFPISIGNLIVGANITPTAVKGSGQPFSQRLSTLNGYYNYKPVFNPHTNSYDTCLIWATLRNGSTVIANAIFKSTDSTGGYQPFSASFNYLSCEMPDTLVILIASSIPNIPSLFNSQGSNLTGGSVLWVDTLSYDTLPSNYEFTPIAVADTASTLKNTPVNIYVKAIDADCSYPTDSLHINVYSQPTNGTAVVYSNSYITYTPNNGFLGVDTFWYTVSDTALTSAPAPVVVTVNANAGISTVNEIPVRVYPVPVGDELHIQFENPGATTAKIYDVTGQLLGSYSLEQKNNTLDVTRYANGYYLLQIVDGENTLLASNRFVVCR